MIHIWTKGEVGAPLNPFKPPSKIFYWPFQGDTSFVNLLCFFSVLCLLCISMRLFICALWSLLGKGWPLGSRLWSLAVSLLLPIGILGQVWYLIVSIPDLCTLTYFGPVEQSVVSSIADTGIVSSIWDQYLCGGWSWTIFYRHSPSFSDSRRDIVSYKRKCMHKVLYCLV